MKKAYFLSRKSWETEVKENQKKSIYFEEEETSSSLIYPAGRKVKTIQQQILLLKEYFSLDEGKILNAYKLPESAEGHLVIPKYYKIASSYNKALEIILDLLQKERPYLLNWRKGELGKDYLRLTRRTKQSLDKLDKTTQGDCIIIPVQIGLQHLGKSARKAYALFKPNEFGLGPFEISTFLLTHLEWLSTPDDLGIDCIGCEYTPYKHGYFKYILFFYFFENTLRFGDRWCGCPDKKFGPATGFLP